MPRKHFLEDMTCTICSSGLGRGNVTRGREGFSVCCPCCGKFRITSEAAEDVAEWELPEAHWTAIAYRLRRLSEREAVPVIDNELIGQLRARARLPLLDELIDEMVLWIGSHTEHPGFVRELTYPEFKGLVGAIGPGSFGQILRSLQASTWIEGDLVSQVGSGLFALSNCQLTPAGWGRYRQLSKTIADSTHAFMAMKYGDPQLDEIVDSYFAPAVSRVGLELRRLDRGQPAGLIDDQLRVQIRTSRLLICDLTHGNRGAYWEAGFAEGLGRPVIYTCREDIFQDSSSPDHPHFDTNHFVTVVWNTRDPIPAAQKLVNTIRATLPGEVVMQDPHDP